MGLGKTASALSVVSDLIKSGKKILFIVPGATIIQWQKQFERWINDNEPDEFGMTSLIALRGSNAILPKGMCCVMSYALIAKKKLLEKLIAANFDGIVIDEIHKFGGEHTHRIKNLWALINLTPSKFADCRIGLTGTPVRNYAKEVINLAKFVEFPPARVTEDFNRKYLTWDRKALYNPTQFHNDFQPFYLRRVVSEVQKDLPEIRRTKLYTEVTNPLLANLYNNQLDLISNLYEHGGQVGSFSILGYLIKLRHLTGIIKAMEPAIIEPIKEYLAGENGAETQRKAVIGIHHRAVTLRLKRSIPEFPHFLIRGGMDGAAKERVKNDFIAYKGGALCQLSIKAAGEGIDGLQFATNKAYIFERQWNGQDELQFIKRIHRTGQINACHIETTIALGTIDEFFDDMCEEKLRYTTQVEDSNWENSPVFLKKLMEKVIASRLPTNQVKGYEDEPEDSPIYNIGRIGEIENELEEIE
jgi:SNF2 family DNA or RNA helicase